MTYGVHTSGNAPRIDRLNVGFGERSPRILGPGGLTEEKVWTQTDGCRGSCQVFRSSDLVGYANDLPGKTASASRNVHVRRTIVRQPSRRRCCPAGISAREGGFQGCNSCQELLGADGSSLHSIDEAISGSTVPVVHNGWIHPLATLFLASALFRLSSHVPPESRIREALTCIIRAVVLACAQRVVWRVIIR